MKTYKYINVFILIYIGCALRYILKAKPNETLDMQKKLLQGMWNNVSDYLYSKVKQHKNH